MKVLKMRKVCYDYMDIYSEIYLSKKKWFLYKRNDILCKNPEFSDKIATTW